MCCLVLAKQSCVCCVVDEERVLVEMACGASLAAVYSGLIGRLQDEGKCSVSFTLQSIK